MARRGSPVNRRDFEEKVLGRLREKGKLFMRLLIPIWCKNIDFNASICIVLFVSWSTATGVGRPFENVYMKHSTQTHVMFFLCHIL